MNQPFYIVHGFERPQSFIEDQHTVDVTILVVDIGGKDASIVRPYTDIREIGQPGKKPVMLFEAVGDGEDKRRLWGSRQNLKHLFPLYDRLFTGRRIKKALRPAVLISEKLKASGAEMLSGKKEKLSLVES